MNGEGIWLAAFNLSGNERQIHISLPFGEKQQFTQQNELWSDLHQTYTGEFDVTVHAHDAVIWYITQ